MQALQLSCWLHHLLSNSVQIMLGSSTSMGCCLSIQKRTKSRIQNVDALDETFQPFPRLPLELRMQIWTEALPSWRLVGVIPRRYAGDPLRLQSHRQLRPFLHTCSESRKIVLDEYHKPILPGSTIVPSIGSSELYINCERDVLYFPTCTSLPGKHDLQYLNQFRRIALSENGAAFLSQMHIRGHHFLAVTLATFKELKELWIVSDEKSTDIRPIERGTPFEDIREAFVVGLKHCFLDRPDLQGLRNVRFYYTVGRTGHAERR